MIANVGEFDAVLTTDTLPLVTPVADGANFTTNELVAPAAIVKGSVTPLTLNAALFALICETVVLAFPTLLIAIDFVDELPTATLPKSNGDGLRESTADGSGTPVAASPTEVGEFVALLTMFRVCETVPVA